MRCRFRVLGTHMAMAWRSPASPSKTQTVQNLQKRQDNSDCEHADRADTDLSLLWPVHLKMLIPKSDQCSCGSDGKSCFIYQRLAPATASLCLDCAIDFNLHFPVSQQTRASEINALGSSPREAQPPLPAQRNPCRTSRTKPDSFRQPTLQPLQPANHPALASSPVPPAQPQAVP